MFPRDSLYDVLMSHGFNITNDKKEDKKMTEEEIKKIALEAVKEALEQTKDTKTGWTPARNEHYVTVDGGRVVDACVNFDQSTTDAAIAAGQCFKTKKEAVDYIEWLKAFKTLKDDTNGYEFEEGINNYYVDYNEDDGLGTDSTAGYRSHLFYFESEEDAEKSIEKHEKEWKAFFGV